jgi:hypothetical protein
MMNASTDNTMMPPRAPPMAGPITELEIGSVFFRTFGEERLLITYRLEEVEGFELG